NLISSAPDRDSPARPSASFRAAWDRLSWRRALRLLLRGPGIPRGGALRDRYCSCADNAAPWTMCFGLLFFAQNLLMKVIGRFWREAPQGTWVFRPGLFLLPVAKLRPCREALYAGRGSRFHFGTPPPALPIHRFFAMVSARFRLI